MNNHMKLSILYTFYDEGYTSYLLLYKLEYLITTKLAGYCACSLR